MPLIRTRNPSAYYVTVLPVLSPGDGDVYYVERGAGMPVVFIHGNWATSSWWEPVLGRLPADWRGIAYDVRGRGRTTGPDSDHSIPALAADLRAVADALGLEAFHLVGHSLGSGIAMQFALDHPARVRSLTAVAPAWVQGMPESPGALERQWALKADRKQFDEAMKWLCPTMPDNPYWRRLLDEGHEQQLKAALDTVAAMIYWSPGDRLRSIPCPKLVIGGEKDPLSNPVVVERAAAALGALRAVMPGVGHGTIIEDPDTFVGYLLEFVRTSS